MKIRIAALSLSLVLATGCKSATDATPENYLNTINAYLPDHADCLLDGSFSFPYETSDPTMTRKLNSLVKAQVLLSSSEPAIHITRYTLTPAGIAAGPRLCFGYRSATGITSSTPPALANGFTETTVVYNYVLHDEPIWAKTPEVIAAFPLLQQETSGSQTGTITLALDRVSWSVPN